MYLKGFDPQPREQSYDLLSPFSFFLTPGETIYLTLGIEIVVPKGYIAAIVPTYQDSSLLVRDYLHALPVYFNSDLPVPLRVAIHNFSDNKDYDVEERDVIAKLVFQKTNIFPIKKYKTLDC